jgi:hypothetical protein
MLHQILPRLREAGERTWLRVLLAGLILSGAFGTISSASASETISAIAGTIYIDSNASGAIDTGDVTARGVTVMLTDMNGAAVLDSSGAPIAPVVTNSRGRYAFFNVRTDQTYRIVEVPPTGYAPNLAVGPIANVVKESNSVLAVSTPTPDGVSTTFDNNKFLLVAPVTIGGYIYIDVDHTHAISAPDTLLADPKVVLMGDFNGDGTPDTAQAVVDSSGHYSFTSWTNPVNGQSQAIPAGIYQVIETVATGYNAVDAIPGNVADVIVDKTILQVAATLPGAAYDNENFLIGRLSVTSLPGSFSISGFVWHDLNADGLRAVVTPVDPGLGGATVLLTGIDSNYSPVTLTTTTAADGSYSFQQLNAGNYTVATDRTTLPAGLDTETFDGIGSIPDGQLDNKVIGVLNLVTNPVANVNFGYTGHGAIGDTVWNDINGNGVFDAGEKGIAGVTVTLIWAGADGQSGTADDLVYAAQVTDVNGNYSFTHLPTGNFKICVDSSSPNLGKFVQTYDLDGLATPNCALVSDLTAGQVRTDVDFGYWQSGSLAGALYVDANTNSQLDTDEARLGGLTVTLKDSNGNTIDTTTTADDGTYSFANLLAGTYSISAPSSAGGYALGTASALAVTLAAGQNVPDNNFGYVANGSLSGVLYVDANKNSTLDSGEARLGGVTVTLHDSSDNVIDTTVTADDGSYSFSGLITDTYSVTAPATANGYSLETAGSLSVDVVAGQNAPNNNFGYIANGSLSGTLYVDANKNSSLDSGEAKLGGVTLTLKDSNGATIATTTSATDGTYSFTGLAAGVYNVSAPTSANGYVLETSSSLPVTLVAGQSALNNDFGYVPYVAPVGSLSGVAYNDVNGNKTYNTGEPLLSGVVITLTKPNGTTVSTTTNASGFYQFSNLPVGSYKVSAPSTISGKTLGTSGLLTVAVVANQNTPNNNFGYITCAPLVGSLSGTVYVDANKNCSLDSGEAKLSGVTLTLKDSSGATIATTTSANDGTYSFTGLAAGAYKVSVPSNINGYSLETASLLSVNVVGGQNTPNNNFGYITCAPPVGSLSGVAYNDVNGNKTYNTGEPLLSGVVITLTKPNGTTVSTTTNASGFYQFSNLPVGSYKVSAPSTVSGKTLGTSSLLTVAVVANQNTPNNNFGYSVASTCGTYTTYTQGGWGAGSHGCNAGTLLTNNFSKVFGCTCVSIGGNNVYKFTSAQAVQSFLPQGGTAAKLTCSATNPTAKTNVFAGQVLALQLNVSFSNAGITRKGLSTLTVVSGPLAGKTVSQVLALANTALGGNTGALTPYGLTLSGLNDIVTSINQNYDNGTTDNHYLH